MRTFHPGLRFWLPVEVVDGHDRGNIVLVACGKQFTIAAAPLEEAGEFPDAGAGAPAAPVVAETVASPPAAPIPRGPRRPVQYVDKPTMHVTPDKRTWRLTFTVADPPAEAPLAFSDEIVHEGEPSGVVVQDTLHALVRRGRAWLQERGYDVDAAPLEVTPDPAADATSALT